MDILTLDGEMQIINDEVLIHELAIGIGNLYYSMNLIIDKINGKPLGLEVTKFQPIEECEYIRKGLNKDFIERFYLIPIYKQYFDIEREFRNKGCLQDNFHIWSKGTRFEDVEKWFYVENNLGYYEDEYWESLY